MSDTDGAGQFTTAVPSPPETYSAEYLERELNEIKSNINELAQAVWILTYGTAVGDRTAPGGTAKTANYDIDPVDDNGFRFSNIGATVDVYFQLPPAVTTVELEFTVDAAYDIFLQPASGERHQLSTVGEAMKLTDIGSLVRLGCTYEGIWRIIRQIGTAAIYTNTTYPYLLQHPDYSPVLHPDGAPVEGL